MSAVLEAVEATWEWSQMPEAKAELEAARTAATEAWRRNDEALIRVARPSSTDSATATRPAGGTTRCSTSVA